MGFEDVLLPAGIINLLTFLAALGVWVWKRPSGAASWVIVVVLAGTGFHLVTDLVADLGVDGEHMLMHAVALGVVLAAAFGPASE